MLPIDFGIHLKPVKPSSLKCNYLNFLCYNADSATNPVNRDEDWETITKFCEQVNKELEGPQIAIRLLAHKIQSPQEREALYALAVSFNFFYVLQTLYYMWYLLFSVNSKQPLFIYTAKQRFFSFKFQSLYADF